MKSATTIQHVEFKGTNVDVAKVRIGILFDPVCLPRHQAIPGKRWHKVNFKLSLYANAQYKFVPWAYANCTGRFACCQIEPSTPSQSEGPTFIMFFEHLNDALKFKLTNAQEVLTDAD